MNGRRAKEYRSWARKHGDDPDERILRETHQCRRGIRVHELTHFTIHGEPVFHPKVVPAATHGTLIHVGGRGVYRRLKRATRGRGT